MGVEDDVKRAVEVLEALATRESGTELEPIYKLAVKALREMRTEPCEWCKPSDQESYKGVTPLDFISFQEFDGWEDRESKMQKHFCPNCGRKLAE